MSDTKRPLGDFSQQNEGYGSVGSNPDVPPLKGTTPLRATPSALFSSKPFVTPGSFSQFSKGDKPETVRLGKEIKRKEPEISPEELAFKERKEALRGRVLALQQKNKELFESLESPNLKNLKNEFDEEALTQKQREIEQQISIILSQIESSLSPLDVDALEKLFLETEINLKETRDSFDEAIKEKYEEAEAHREDLRLFKERTPLLTRYSAARAHAGKLYERISRETSAKLYEIISKLEWLLENQTANKELSKDEIDGRIKILENLVEAAEQEAMQHEKTTKDSKEKENARNELIKKFLPLLETYARYVRETEDIFPKIDKGEGRAKLQDVADSLAELKVKISEEPSEALLAGFSDLLNDYENLLIEAKASLSTLEIKTVPALDIFSGWPENRITFIKGNPKQKVAPYWQFVNDEGKIEVLPDTQRWTAEKENFESVFKEYSDFLKTDDIHYKLENYKDLIKAKNDVVEALLRKELILAGNLREILRLTIKKSADSYEKFTKEKNEKEAKEKDKKERVKTLEGRLHNLTEEYNSIVKASEAIIVSALSTQEFLDLSKLRESLQNSYALIPKDSLEEGVIADFEAQLRHFEAIVNAAKTRIEKQKKLSTHMRPKARIPRVIIPKGTDLIKLRDGREITVAERQKELEEQGSQAETEKAMEKQNSIEELLATHRDMFIKNPLKYKELYLNKTFVKGDPNELASRTIFGEYLEELRGKVSELLDQKAVIEGLVPDEAIESGSNMTAREKVEEIKYQISILEDEIRQLTDAPVKARLEEIRRQGQEKRTLRATRLTYSPASDASLNHIPIEGKDMTRQERAAFKIAVHERNAEAEKAKRDTQTQEEVKNLSVNSMRLDDKTAPNVGGMTRSLDEEDVKRLSKEEKKDLTDVGPVIAHAEMNREPTPEQKAMKHKSVGRLMETLSNLGKKSDGSWRFWVLAGTALAIGGGASILLNKKDEPTPPAKTLEQVASWRDNLQTKEIQEFVKDLYGKDQLDYIPFMKKHLPSVNINEKNPSTIAALSAMECSRLFNAPEAVYGLSDPQRQEVCTMARNMEKTIQYTQAKWVMSSGFKQHDYAYTDSNISIAKLYEIVREEISKADRKEGKLI